jgi:hypothetical protein
MLIARRPSNCCISREKENKIAIEKGYDVKNDM